jgi:MFS family permease
MAGAPAGGWAADRFGRRRSLLLGLVAFSIAVLLLPFGRTRGELALATGLVEFANVFARPSIHASIADLVPPAHRARAFGLFRAAMNVGFAAGAAIGGLLARGAYTGLFLVDSGTAALAALLVFLALRETRPAPDPFGAPGGEGGRGPLGRFALFLLLALLVNVVASQMTSNFAISLRRRGVGEASYGRLLALNGLFVALAQVPVTVLSSKARMARGLALGALLYGAGYGIAAFSVDLVPLLLCVSVLTLGEMLFVPLSSAFVALLAPPGLRGRYMGALQLTYGLARVIAPPLGAAILHRHGDRTLWLFSPAVGAVAALGLLLLDRPKTGVPEHP